MDYDDFRAEPPTEHRERSAYKWRQLADEAEVYAKLDREQGERTRTAGPLPDEHEERAWREMQHDLYGAGEFNPRED